MRSTSPTPGRGNHNLAVYRSGDPQMASDARSGVDSEMRICQLTE